MIHEAMVLEYSGADLGSSFWANRCAWCSCWDCSEPVRSVGSRRPAGGAVCRLGLLALVAKVCAVGATIAVFEVFTAKLRLFRLPELLAGGFVLALLGALTAVVR